MMFAFSFDKIKPTIFSTASLLSVICSRPSAVLAYNDLNVIAERIPLIVVPSVKDLAAPELSKISFAAISNWVGPIDSYGPPHDDVPPEAPSVCIGGDVLPPDPVQFLFVAKTHESELMKWLQEWEKKASQNDAPTEQDISRLKQILASTSLTSGQVYEIARGVTYIYHLRDDAFDDVDPTCVELTAQFVRLAGKELDPGGNKDVHAEEIVRELSRLTWLWGSRDYATTARAYDLIGTHSPANSKRSRRATFLQAEALCMQGETPAALILYQKGQDLEASLKDISSADKAEIDWATGIALLGAGRCSDAKPYLSNACGRLGAYYEKNSFIAYAQCLARLGDVQGAKESFHKWVTLYHPTDTEARDALTQILSYQ